MPHTPKKPPTKRVDELKKEVTEMLHKKFDKVQMPDKVHTIIDYLITELAKEKEKNEILSKK